MKNFAYFEENTTEIIITYLKNLGKLFVNFKKV